MLPNIFGKNTAFGDSVSAKSYYNYNADFDIWRENHQFKRQNNARSQPPLRSTPVGKKQL